MFTIKQTKIKRITFTNLTYNNYDREKYKKFLYYYDVKFFL